MQMFVASLQPVARQEARALDYIMELKYDRPVTIFDDQLIDERRNVTYPQEREHSLYVNLNIFIGRFFTMR